MTAVAKLPGIIGSMLNFADVADRCELTEGNAPAAIRAWANQLAALSPAELGGVVLFHRLHQPNYSSEWIRGDYTGPESTQRGWSVERVYSTPRAAEAGWLPIESIPGDAKRVLVHTRLGECHVEYVTVLSGAIAAARMEDEPCFFTHWQPLPAPPALTTGKKES